MTIQMPDQVLLQIKVNVNVNVNVDLLSAIT